MKSLLAAILSVSVLLAFVVEASPTSQLTEADLERREESLNGQPLKPQSPHLRLADRLLKRVLDLTYETLQDIGASEEDLDSVRRKRNYIQSCYFHAISCY